MIKGKIDSFSKIISNLADAFVIFVSFYLLLLVPFSWVMMKFEIENGSLIFLGATPLSIFLNQLYQEKVSNPIYKWLLFVPVIFWDLVGHHIFH